MEVQDVEHGRTWEAHVGSGAEQEPSRGGLEVWVGHETVVLRRRTKSLEYVGWWKETKSLVPNPTWRSKLEVTRKTASL